MFSGFNFECFYSLLFITVEIVMNIFFTIHNFTLFFSFLHWIYTNVAQITKENYLDWPIGLPYRMNTRSTYES